MIYSYQCSAGHRFERIRKMADRDEPTPCPQCKHSTRRVIDVPHTIPDGVYSYAPNLGSEEQFSNRLDAQRAGKKVLDKVG